MSNKNLIITNYRNKTCSFLMDNNRLLAVNTLDPVSRIGSVYIGKIKNILNNINACFVEISDNETCFLPFTEAEKPCCVNRRLNGGKLAQGDEILVQIIKEAHKTKQACVTCNISYTSPCFVFTTGNTTLGISSKLNKSTKSRIKQILEANHIETSDVYGMIVRTEAAELLAESEELFLEVLEKEKDTFLSIFTKARHSNCFQCIYEPDSPYNRLLENYHESEYDEVVTDLNEAYTALQGINKSIRLYTDTEYPLDKLYSLETRMAEALGKKIWLKSGANLIIEQTECLTTIDINSGKNIKSRLTDDTIREINREAAREIALQLRLRNLSGIIIVDFINMTGKDAEVDLIQEMKDLTCTGKIKTNIVDITPLGLMEITRQKINKTLSEEFKG